MQVMSEACCIFPTSGAFVDHAARFVDPALGFAIGKTYHFLAMLQSLTDNRFL
jgi:amino acid permease